DKASSTVVETLLAAGADVSIRDKFRSSALDSASLCGHAPTIHALVRHGVGVTSCDDRGDTALHKAALQDQAASVDALIEAGAGMEMKRTGGATPVWIAAFFCSPKTLLALFLKGAITNAPDNRGKTPLHVACLPRGGDLAAVVDLLLRWGADETPWTTRAALRRKDSTTCPVTVRAPKKTSTGRSCCWPGLPPTGRGVAAAGWSCSVHALRRRGSQTATAAVRWRGGKENQVLRVVDASRQAAGLMTSNPRVRLAEGPCGVRWAGWWACSLRECFGRSSAF
ncbi:unnamed protein product, partial [Ectocarpus sp. 13 AM-2016]